MIVVASLIPACRDDTSLHGPYAGMLIYCGCQGLSRQFILGQVGKESSGINKYRMASYRPYNGNASLVHSVAEVYDLFYTMPYVVVVHSFSESSGECFHVSAGHPTVAGHSFIHDNQACSLSVEILIVYGKETAHIDNSVFLGRHRETVRVAEHLPCNIYNAAVGIARLTLFDKHGIFGETGSVNIQHNLILFGNSSNFAHIGH